MHGQYTVYDSLMLKQLDSAEPSSVLGQFHSPPKLMSVSLKNSIELMARQLEPESPAIPAASRPDPDSDLDSRLSDTALNRNESSLLPVDRGFGAYSFLASAFWVETIVWGFPNAFGVFLDVYLQDEELMSQPGASTLLPLIGTLSSGIMYCFIVFINPLMNRYPHWRRPMIWAGALGCFASLFGASYTKNVNLLLALQGILYSLTGAFIYAPCISYMPEWFAEKRGMANGVLFAGTAAGGLVLPIALTPLLNSLGPSKTLRILAITVGVTLLPILPLVRGRLPNNRVHGPSARSSGNYSYLKSKIFWLLMVSNMLQGIAYFIPVTWLPTFATALHVSKTKSSLTLSLLNGASLGGRLAMGLLSDRFNPWILAFCSLVATSITTFVVWGVLSESFASLAAYSVLYGAIASGWSSLFSQFVKNLAQDDHTLVTSLFGYLMLSRGIGNILSTPISTSLQGASGNSNSSGGHRLGFDVDGGRYEKMIIFTGTCFAGTAIICAVGWVAGATNGFGIRRTRGGASA